MSSILDRLAVLEEGYKDLKNPSKYSAINKREEERKDSRIAKLQEEVKTLKIILGLPLE